MTDHITKAFSKIKPVDFISSAAHFFEHTPGPESFEQFIARHLYSTRYAFVVADGLSNPVSALSDGRVERLFAAYDHETIKDLTDRISRIAKATGSSRFFFSRLVPAAAAAPGTPQLGPKDALWKQSLMWFGEDSTTGEHRIGVMEVIDKVRLGEPVTFDSLIGELGQMLGAVLHS